MPTTLLATALLLPADLVSVRAGDVDGDGRDELVMVSHTKQAPFPDEVTLTIAHIGDDGRATQTHTLQLGNEARLWDIQDGLWLVDGQGIARLKMDGGLERVATLTTPMAGLGPTTPKAADIAHDLDGDGVAEVLAFSRGAVHASSADGTSWGAVAAPPEGALNTISRAGGTVLSAAARMPAIAVGDVDGDGQQDLLLPTNDRLRVAFSSSKLAARVQTMELPMDLEPAPDIGRDKSQQTRRVERSWFTDLDHDGRVDLLVQQSLTKGSWFGATGELTVAIGTGSGFPVTETLKTDAAVVDVQLIDIDGDGDTDLLVATVDANMGNLASALLSKVVKIEPLLFIMADGRYGAPIKLDKLKLPIDASDRFQLEVGQDVDGDGNTDLVTNGGEDHVEVRPGTGVGFADEPIGWLDVVVPSGEDTLFVHDLTGDGRAEIVVWGPGEPQGQILRLP